MKRILQHFAAFAAGAGLLIAPLAVMPTQAAADGKPATPPAPIVKKDLNRPMGEGMWPR